MQHLNESLNSSPETVVQPPSNSSDEQSQPQQSPSISEKLFSESKGVKTEIKEEGVNKDPKEEEKADQKKPTSILSKLLGEEEKVSVPEDYTIHFPEGMPEEQIQSTKEMFIKNGLSKDDAQLLTDGMVQSLQTYQQQQEEAHNQRYEQDIKRLKEEYGSQYRGSRANIDRFVKEADLPRETLEAFATYVGAYDTFKLFEKLSCATKDASYAPPPRSESLGNKFKDYSKIFDDPKFNEKLKSGDPEAQNLLKEWARIETLSQQ